jgi:hypothetical protein
MSFSVELSNELHLKNVEDESRLQQSIKVENEKTDETTNFDDTNLKNQNTTPVDNESTRQLISHLSSHNSGITMENSEGSEEDLY